MNQSQAFDPLAPTYDGTFTHSPIGQYLRAQIHARLDLHFQAGHHVLELGCGTGEDASYLADRGVHVTATDVSEGMLTTARAKAINNPLITFVNLDLRSLSSENAKFKTDKYSGVFSNFGPLNCLDDWQPLAAWLSERVKPGGIVGLGVMSPLCVWEPLWHGIHGDFKTATRRWRKSTTFQVDDTTEPIIVRYPTIRRMTRDFAPFFKRTYVQGIGLFLPPSDVFGVIEKHPRLMEMLMNLESRFTRYQFLAPFADHYWIEFERT
jgi:SAM-dependent methyltransferase